MTEFEYSNSDEVFPSQIITDRLIINRTDVSDENPRELYKKLTSESAIAAKPETYPVAKPRNVMDVQNRYFDDVNDEEESISYFIREKRTDEIAGIFAVFPTWDCKRLETGIWLDSDYWGNGYSTERGEAVLELAFKQLDFEYVRVRTAPDNQNAQKAIERYILENGGRKDGRVRGDLYNENTREVSDQIYYSITKTEYIE